MCIRDSYKCTIQIYQSGVSSTIFKKSAWDLDFPGENRDVRGILRNLIGCLEQLGTRKYIFFTEKQNLGLVYTSAIQSLSH